jgi:hypothetical protein
MTRRKQHRRGNRYCGLCACKKHAWAKTTRAMIVMVSPCDAHLIASRRWCTIKSGSRTVLYAKAGTASGRRQPLLHRLICKPGSRRLTDHKNGHGLDCRRGNLRPATRRQNAANRVRVRRASPFRGVTVSKSGRRWHAYCAGKHLGSFSSPTAAARAYNHFAKRRYGAFAIVNSFTPTTPSRSPRRSSTLPSPSSRSRTPSRSPCRRSRR